MLYLSIKIEKKQLKNKEKKTFIEKLLSFILPIANPDFEDKIHYVSEWMLEFNDDKSYPIREIGLDSKGEVILKMPFKKNYGYWIDNNFVYKDFLKKFNYKIINKKTFEKNWVKIK